MKIVYLKEGKEYETDELLSLVRAAGCANGLTDDFFKRLRTSINDEHCGKAIAIESNGKLIFHYVGLYDYVDMSGANLTFFFWPKFIDEEHVSEEWCRNVILQAIDRKGKEDSRIDAQLEFSERKREGLLELAVRMLRDYLEHGLYVVHRTDLELNGQGEIDWNTTIDTFQPIVKKGRPYYMETLTEQAYSDEDHYITRLHKCLITHWGRKLEDLGLASALRVKVPLLSDEQLDRLGGSAYQVAQINRELGVQFVTKSRETLVLMRELIERASENQAMNRESLSFGMTGVEHLWEDACAAVLGSELDKQISECGFDRVHTDVTFRDYMPRVFWKNLDDHGGGVSADDGADDGKGGWRLDFVRTWQPETKSRPRKLVILDAKYYCISWEGKKVSGVFGISDIAKQIFYQKAFYDLVDNKDVINAFLIPGNDSGKGAQDLKLAEVIAVKSRLRDGGGLDIPKAFKDIHLFTVRIPGIRLLELYADYKVADDWFETIVRFGNDTASRENES